MSFLKRFFFFFEIIFLVLNLNSEITAAPKNTVAHVQKRVAALTSQHMARMKNSHQKHLSSLHSSAIKSPYKIEKDIKVLGRLDDTREAIEWHGHEVLDIPDWSIKKNDEWVSAGIKNKQDFYTASPEKGNLWDHENNRETVYARELNQIKAAGYVKQGDTYIHPDNR